MSTKRICFTKNNYTDEDIRLLLDSSRFSYIIFGKEVGESGTPHLQGYAEFFKVTKYAGIAKIHQMHCEVTKGTQQQAIDYCKKEGDWIEKGEARDETGGSQGAAAEKKRWELARIAATQGRFEDIPADIYVKYYGNIHKIYSDSMPQPPSNDTLENEWIYGPTGVGKSRDIRNRYPLLFNKPPNKWWDGYTNQETVLLDDVGLKQAEWLGEFLKTWSDHYPFIADYKGKARCIRPKRIIVTSNYSLEEMFQDTNILEPLKRRFKQVHYLNPLIINKN